MVPGTLGLSSPVGDSWESTHPCNDHLELESKNIGVSTQLSWNIVCQCMVDTESKSVRMSLTKYSIYNLGGTLCVKNQINDQYTI